MVPQGGYELGDSQHAQSLCFTDITRSAAPPSAVRPDPDGVCIRLSQLDNVVKVLSDAGTKGMPASDVLKEICAGGQMLSEGKTPLKSIQKTLNTHKDKFVQQDGRYVPQSIVPVLEREGPGHAYRKSLSSEMPLSKTDMVLKGIVNAPGGRW